MEAKRNERRVATAIAGIWLVFLVYPIVWLTNQPHTAFTIVGGIALGVFVLQYLAYFWQHFDRSRWVGQAADPRCQKHYVCALALGVVLLIFWPPIGTSVSPYLQAQAANTLRERVSLIQLPVLIGLILGVGYLSDLPGAAIVSPCIGLAMVQVFSMLDRRQIQAAEQERRQARRDARIAERNRIAHDMHDLLGHSLTVMALKAQVLERLITKDPDRAVAEARDLHTSTREVLNQLRSTVGALRVMDLDEQLDAAQAACRAAGIDLVIHDLREASGASGAREAAQAWIVREALTNVIRHAHASSASIELTDHHLIISDNGIGFEPGAAPENTGIASMRTRADDVGLAFAITSSGTGTTITVSGGGNP